MKRNLILSPAFKEFEQNANPRTREKLRYTIYIGNSLSGTVLSGTHQVRQETGRDRLLRVAGVRGQRNTGHPVRRGQRQHQSGDKRHPAERLCEEKHQGLRQGNNKGD